jgi:hypothetical protein
MFAMTRTLLALDYLLYPQLRKVRLDRPVMILGHPRSGTTFFQHHIFGSHTAGMFSTWELFFPSLIQRRILAPFVWLMNLMGVDLVQSPEYGHEIRIDGVEEDEGIFMHRLDTEILTFNCPWLLTDPEFTDTGFRLGWLGKRERRRSAEFYREILKRQAVASGYGRIVVKCNTSVFRLEELLEVFPDLRVVYVVRSPELSLRSYLAFAHRFVDPLLTETERRIYSEKKYRWSLELYRAFERVRESIPDGQLLVVRFDEISQRVTDALQRFFQFADLTPDDRFWRQFRERRAHRHRKRHVNRPLADFGISEEHVRRDLAFVWERYLSDAPADTGPSDPDALPPRFDQSESAGRSDATQAAENPGPEKGTRNGAARDFGSGSDSGPVPPIAPAPGTD